MPAAMASACSRSMHAPQTAQTGTTSSLTEGQDAPRAPKTASGVEYHQRENTDHHAESEERRD